VDTLPLHHKAHFVKGAAVDKVALYIGCKGGLELVWQALVEEGERSHTIRGHPVDAEVMHVISHDNVAGFIHRAYSGDADGASDGVTVSEVGMLEPTYTILIYPSGQGQGNDGGGTGELPDR
jgi:hypothetical protein